MTFLFPVAGWLFLLLPPLLWWPMRARPRWGQAALRAAVFACLIVAMMQPSLVRRDGAGAQVYILDQREVLGADGQAMARRALDRVRATAPGGAATTVIQLGGTATGRLVIRDGSLSQALRAAARAIPLGSGGAVTLIGSGLSTDTHWRAETAALVARGIPVNSIAVPTAPRAAFVGDVRTAPARVGEMLHADILLEGDGGTHRIAVFDGDRRLAASAPFRADGETHVALDIPPSAPGSCRCGSSWTVAAGSRRWRRCRNRATCSIWASGSRGRRARCSDCSAAASSSTSAHRPRSTPHSIRHAGRWSWSTTCPPRACRWRSSSG